MSATHIEPHLGHAEFRPYENEKPAAVNCGLVPKTYEVLRQAVEEGVAYGVRRAQKHTNWSLTVEQESQIKSAVEEAVLSSICEWFKVDGEG